MILMIGGIVLFMSSKNMSTAKSVGIGLAVGTMAAVVSSKMMSRSGMKMCKKSVTKCMKTMGNMMDDIMSMTR